RIKGTTKMPQLGGLYSEYPKISLLMAIVLFSLVGIPPLSGFWPKINLFSASFEQGEFILIFALIFASFITLYVIAKMWAEVFWKDSPLVKDGQPNFADRSANLSPFSKGLLIFPIVLLTGVSLYIGFGAENIM